MQLCENRGRTENREHKNMCDHILYTYAKPIWHTSWTISFMSLFAALKSSGWVLFSKRDNIYKNRIGQKWERKGKRKRLCKPLAPPMVFTGITSNRLAGYRTFLWIQCDAAAGSFLRESFSKHSVPLGCPYLGLLLILKDGLGSKWRGWQGLVIRKNWVQLDNAWKRTRTAINLSFHFLYQHCTSV